MKDTKLLARQIVSEHTGAMMSATSYHPANISELYEFMVDGCAYILSEKLVDGELTPMEYNDTRNEIASILWEAFEPFLKSA